MQHHHSEHRSEQNASRISRYVFFGFVAVAAFFLIVEHRAHLYGIWPWLLLAACPLMHLFHHGGHGHGHSHGHGHGGSDEQSKRNTEER